MKLIQWSVVCAFTSHNNEKCGTIFNEGGVCDFTSHNNEKSETIFNEGWCVTLHHTTMRSVRLYSMKGGAWDYIRQQWEVRDYTPCRMVCVCVFILHHIEKCETIFHERWCVTLNHTTMRSVRLYSMKGGAWDYITRLWEVWDYTHFRVVCESTLHNNEKCASICNEGCVCVWVYIT